MNSSELLQQKSQMENTLENVYRFQKLLNRETKNIQIENVEFGPTGPVITLSDQNVESLLNVLHFFQLVDNYRGICLDCYEGRFKLERTIIRAGYENLTIQVDVFPLTTFTKDIIKNILRLLGFYVMEPEPNDCKQDADQEAFEEKVRLHEASIKRNSLLHEQVIEARLHESRKNTNLSFDE